MEDRIQDVREYMGAVEKVLLSKVEELLNQTKVEKKFLDQRLAMMQRSLTEEITTRIKERLENPPECLQIPAPDVQHGSAGYGAALGSAYEDAARRLHETTMECAAVTQGQGEEALRHIHGEGERVMREIRQKEEGLGRAMQSMVERIKSEVGTAMHMKWEEMKVGVRREISEEV
jgi:hypothetical protein